MAIPPLSALLDHTEDGIRSDVISALTKLVDHGGFGCILFRHR
jgi:hypothetical protein